MAHLYVVATPIGNLEDITLRAVRILREVPIVVSEDTRVTHILLKKIESSATLISFHEFSDLRRLEPILEALAEGKDVAVVTDAGTPAISDPGAYLVHEVLHALPETKIVPIPGPSALTATLSASGFRAEPFTFFGFPPAKKGRVSFFASLKAREETLVFFESPHRIQKTMDALHASLGDERPTFVARELTKIHETHYRGTLQEVTKMLKTATIKGEFVIVIAPA